MRSAPRYKRPGGVIPDRMCQKGLFKSINMKLRASSYYLHQIEVLRFASDPLTSSSCFKVDHL